MQPPFSVLVPAGYKTYFEQGSPAVAEFAFPTEVRIDFKVNEQWFGASSVKGFPEGRSVLFYGPDVGVKLRLVQRMESTLDVVRKILVEKHEGPIRKSIRKSRARRK